MADDLKDQIKLEGQGVNPPDIDTILAGGKRRWRLSPKRMSLCLGLFAVIGIATINIPQSGDDLSELYVEMPQSTDWLLNIPDENWLEDIPTHNEKG